MSRDWLAHVECKRHGLYLILPIALKRPLKRERRKKKCLVKRQGCPQYKPTQQAEHWGSTRDFEQNFLGFLAQVQRV